MDVGQCNGSRTATTIVISTVFHCESFESPYLCDFISINPVVSLNLYCDFKHDQANPGILGVEDSGYS